MGSDDKKRALWFLLALSVIFVHNLYTHHRAEEAQADAMIDAAEIKALVRWAAWRSDSR
jgi:hypothetical protein